MQAVMDVVEGIVLVLLVVEVCQLWRSLIKVVHAYASDACVTVLGPVQIFLRYNHPDELDGKIKRRHTASTVLTAAARGFLGRRRLPDLRAHG